MQMKISLILYVICFIAGLSNAVRPTPFDALYEACPYTDFCQSSASKVFKDDTSKDMPCCLPCFCDQDCERRQDCCPDKPVNNTGDASDPSSESNQSLGDPDLTCKETIVKRSTGKKTTHFNGYSSGVLRYRIVDQCPDTELNTTTSVKCAETQHISIADYVWVTDKTTGKIYKNRHCAQCHAVENFAEWNLKALCSLWLHDDLEMTHKPMLSDECDLINELPNDEAMFGNVDMYRCYRPNVNYCNATGDLAYYDEHYAEACESFVYPFLQHDNRVFKNMFCYACNGYSLEETTDVCPRSYFSVKSDIAFTALINWQVEEKSTQRAEMSCDKDEVYDQFKDKCRKLLCPFGTEPLYGKCEEYFIILDGVAIEANYNLTILWNLSSITAQSIEAYDKNELGQTLHTKFKRLIGLTRTKCYPCGGIVSISDRDILESTTLQYMLQLSTHTGCPLDTLYKNAISILNTNIRLDMGGSEYLTLTVTLDKRSNIAIGDSRKTILLFDRPKVCDVSHVIDDKYCPAIQVNKSLIRELSDTSRMAETLDYATRSDEENITVCLDDYLFDMQRLNGHVADNSVLSMRFDVVMVITLYVAVLCIVWL